LIKKDAEFVDIIHCNMGKTANIHDAVIKGRYGSTVQSGSVDFYPNGGERQAGCGVFDEKIQKPCSQRRCSEMFATSITEKYLACPCDDYETYQKGTCDCTKDDSGVLMGAQCCSSKKGKKRLYLNTMEDGKPKGDKKSKKDKKKKDDDDEEKDDDKKDKDTITDDDDDDDKKSKKDKKKKDKKEGSDEEKDDKEGTTTKKPKKDKKTTKAPKEGGSDEEKEDKKETASTKKPKEEKKDGSGEEKAAKKKSSEEK